jgi:sulfur transfer complex TusBCD TusB component (DsrH family)
LAGSAVLGFARQALYRLNYSTSSSLEDFKVHSNKIILARNITGSIDNDAETVRYMRVVGLNQRYRFGNYQCIGCS